jgi:hypothetical protein
VPLRSRLHQLSDYGQKNTREAEASRVRWI